MRGAETERIPPPIHVGHQAVATYAGEFVGEHDLQVARCIFLGLRVGRIGVDARALCGRRDDQVTGLVQQRMYRRVGACIDRGADHAGFRYAPVAAGNRGIGTHGNQSEVAPREQRTCGIDIDIGEGEDVDRG